MRNQKALGTLLFAVLMLVGYSGMAQDKVYKPLVNRWKPDQRIRVNFFDVVAGQANDGDKTAIWCFNPVQGTEFVNLENADKSCIKAQFGGLAAGFASTWDESLWAIEKVAGTEFVEIKNKSTGTYLHIQNGKLELGPREPGWLSSQWILTDNPGKVMSATGNQSSDGGNSKDTEKGMTGLNLAKEADKGASNVVTGMDKIEKGTDNLGKKISKKGDKGAAKVTKGMDKVEKGTDKVGQGIATESDKLTTGDISATKTEQGAAKTEQGMSGLASGLSKESDKLSKNDNSSDKNNANNAAVVTKIDEPKEAVYELKCSYSAGGTMKNTTITVTCDSAKTDGMGVTRGKVFFKKTFSAFTVPGGELSIPFTSPRATKVLNFRFETSGSDAFTIINLTLQRDKEQLAHWTTDSKNGFCLSMGTGNKACSPYWTFMVEGNSAVKY